MSNVRVTESELEEILLNSIAKDVSTKFMNYEGTVVTDVYPLIADSIENFEVRDDDVWVCTFPKTGTTWTQEMVWCIGNNLDFERAKANLFSRFPYLELSGAAGIGWASLRKPESQVPDFISKSVEYAANLPSPRFIKTHLPFHLLPRQLRTGEKKCKFIYAARNPKDTCISYFHHYKMIEGYIVLFTPFWEHIIGYWEKKNEFDLLFLKYEDMKRDLPSVIRKTATYLGKSLSDQQVNELNDHLSFSSMKSNKSLNGEDVCKELTKSKIYGDKLIIEGSFVRSGVVGQWKTSMTEEMIKQFNDWTAKRLKNHGDLLQEFP